ncbi:FAD-dependent oxidoreductase [Parasphingopyxis sp. GrpM-11]|uniref:FAD-dependent oxidoreductase n=2 Tax=Parasphingopyxis marina TaxID=2761622 RepID=A0A842HWH3_9SPHN|nr:FAD-dependent oxidoreductase [Parasphingopyxis marina]
MNYTHVDKPIRIGKSLEVKNRVVRPAHATNFGNGVMNERLINYHAARAAGGVALSIIEILSVHPSSPGTLRIYEDGMEEGYRALVEAVRPHGMKIFQQLWHAGHAAPRADGGPPWSASDVVNPRVNVVPIPMTKAMIDEIVDAYANTAALMEQWGMDGIDLHAAHSYLPHQFLSPNTNLREDDYGGSLENRCRFTIEILEAIRARVSPDFVVGVRVAPDETKGGVGPDELTKVVALLEERNLIDYVNISMGSYQAFAKIIGGMHEPAGYELATSVPVAKSTTLPTMVIGRFRTLEEADQVIRSGDADMVGMVRATIADPDLVKKSLDGNSEGVRPCIGCNQACAARPLGVVGCAVNPATGFEDTLSENLLARVQTARRILVVGAGPAGLEAARVAALRGHEVVLAEAQPDLGGSLKFAAMAPARQGFADILFWLEQEVYRLGVEVRLSTYLGIEDVREIGADKVIVATGAMPRYDGIQACNPGEPIEGFDLAHVVTSLDLFSMPAQEVMHAVVVDDLGHYEAAAAAELLVSRGTTVEFVTRHAAFAPLSEAAHMTEPALARLQRGDFTVHTRTRVKEITHEHVIVSPAHDYLFSNAPPERRLRADKVVFVSANRSNRELYDELCDLGMDVEVIGDAFAPRFLESAMREGRMAGANC